MRFLFTLCFALMAYAATAEEAIKPPQATAKDAETGKPVYMVYGVTGEAPVPFRAKPSEDEKVFGYFPPHKAVWMIRPQKPWVLVYFKEVTGWIKEDDLLTFFTIDPATGIPQ